MSGQDSEVAVLREQEVSVVARLDERTAVVQEPSYSVAVAEESRPVVLTEEQLRIVAMGQQGPAGPVGPIGPAGDLAISVTAGAALGGHRIVYLDSNYEAQYASNQVASHALIALGLTLGAASMGASVDVQRSGEVTEPSWSWTLEQPVYLGDNGQLTQTAPTSPALFQRIVGFPTAATKLFLALREPVFLA